MAASISVRDEDKTFNLDFAFLVSAEAIEMV